jgi:hypothetical protein
MTATLQPKYGVKAESDKKTDFAKFKTYTWWTGHPALDKSVDAQIVAAIDRELGRRGLQKLASGTSDVLVAYDSVQRTDVDLKAKPTKDGTLPLYAVGTLVIRVLEPGSLKELFRARIDTPISIERNKLEQEINAAVAALFEKYPIKAQPM